MKFIVNKKDMQRAVSAAAREAAVKSSIPAMEGVLVALTGNGLSVTGYDLTDGITTIIDDVEVVEEGKPFAAPRMFESVIRSMPDGDILIAYNEESHVCHVECGKAKMDIMSTPADEYPELPSVDSEGVNIEMDADAVARLFSITFACATTDTRPVMKGLLVERGDAENEIVAVSCDGFKLAVRREKAESVSAGFDSVVIPAEIANNAARLCKSGTACMNVSGRHVHIKIGNTIIFGRRIEGDFLDWKKSVFQGNLTAFASRSDLMAVSDRAALFATANGSEKFPVVFKMTKEGCGISVKSVVGTLEDAFAIVSNIETLEIAFNNTYLKEVLNGIESNQDKLKLTLGGPTAPMLVAPADDNDTSFMFMLLPIRIHK